MEALNTQTMASDPAADLITNNLELWTSAIQSKSASGRGSGKKLDLYGIKKLRELILELAVRGELVPQDPNDEPASVLLERIEAEKEQLVKDKKIKKPKALPPIADDERPFDLPTGWEWTRLGSIGFTQTGGTPKKTHPDHFGTDIPFIKPADIQASGVEYDNEGLSCAGEIALGRTAPAGSILMVCIGTIGKCCFIDRPCTFNQQINSVTPFTGITAFLFRALSANYFQNSAWALSSSTTIAILNKGKWESLAVPLPPLSEQHRIVAKVDELMTLCDQLEQQTEVSIDAHATLVKTLLATLTKSNDAAELEQNWSRIADHFDTLFTTEHSIDQLKQTVLQLAVMGKLAPQDPNDEPAAVLLEKIAAEKAQLVEEKRIKKQKPLPPIGEDEKLFELPKGWEWCRLLETVSILGDGLHGTPHYDAKGEYYFVNGNNLRDGNIVIKPETKRVNQREYDKHRKQLNERTVLVSINGTLGNVAFYKDEAVMLGKSACYFNLWKQLDKNFYKRLIESPYFLNYAFSRATGSTIKNLGLKAMSEMPIALPPVEEQHRIVAKVDQLMALCDQLKVQLKQSNETSCHLADAVVSEYVN